MKTNPRFTCSTSLLFLLLLPALARAEIAVVDDVMTTGATLDELAATLKRAGAARVVNWVVARTPPPADA